MKVVKSISMLLDSNFSPGVLLQPMRFLQFHTKMGIEGFCFVLCVCGRGRFRFVFVLLCFYHDSGFLILLLLWWPGSVLWLAALSP